MACTKRSSERLGGRLKIGDKVRVLKTGEVGIIERVQWRSSSGSCVAYISEIQVLLLSGKNASFTDPRLLEVFSG